MANYTDSLRVISGEGPCKHAFHEIEHNSEEIRQNRSRKPRVSETTGGSRTNFKCTCFYSFKMRGFSIKFRIKTSHFPVELLGFSWDLVVNRWFSINEKFEKI